MEVQEELRLSYYKRLGTLDEAHQVYLVQHVASHRLFVEKHLTVYSKAVFESLMKTPIHNIPRIYELVEDNLELIVIEEYVDGITLASMLEKGTLSESEAVRITCALCEIVEQLHARTPPIIHRDIKPSNILLTEDGDVKLVDLDAAKPYTGAADRDTQLIGTTGYAAPEQYGFGSSDVRTDIYAIGVLMAEMVHGVFSRSQLTNGVYDRTAEKCTRLDPALRFSSVKEIRSALARSEGRKTGRSAAPKREIRWLPPGFRALNPLYMVLMGLWYLMVMMGSLSAELEHTSETDLILNRICFLLALLLSTFFAGNYLDIWDRVGISRIKSPYLRIPALIGMTALVFCIPILILVIIEMALKI